MLENSVLNLRFENLTPEQQDAVETAYIEMRAEDLKDYDKSHRRLVLEMEIEDEIHHEWFEEMELVEQYQVLGMEVPMQFDHEHFYVQDWERLHSPEEFELIVLDMDETKAFRVTMPYDDSKMGYDPDQIDDYMGTVFEDLNRFLRRGEATAVACDMPVS